MLAGAKVNISRASPKDSPTDGGWVLTAPPYHPGTDYARGLRQVGSKYIILHKDGAIYDSLDGWYINTPPYYPGTNYAVDLEVQ